MPDPWQVLGLAPGTPWPDVRARRRQLARDLHPDLHHDPTAAARLAEVNAAFDALAPAVEAVPDTFTVDDFRPVVFEAVLLAAAEIGDVLDVDEPFSLDLRVDGALCHVELVPEAGGSVVIVDDAGVSAALVDALERLGLA